MAPVPQEHAAMEPEVPSTLDPNRVVISGMSGLYPNSKHVQDLHDILYNKINPLSSETIRWVYNHPEVAQFSGVVPDLDRFDAQFFKVHYRLGNNMDPMGRKVLEQSYQAIYDAGVSPEHLSGKKVGVYIGTCFSETEKACFYAAGTRTGFGIAGCSKTMFANRISYWLNAKGPSLGIDEACCSSIAALEQAYLAITRGECEAAIVGGANLCLHPQSSVHYGRIMKLCMDGKTKSFDQHADGCAKSEAINVLFLQRAKNAKRIYADVLYVKTEFTEILTDETGGPRYGFYRQPATVAKFLTNFYKEAGVPPNQVEYVEAFGSAVPEADKAELEALGAVFCPNREQPLMVGSVMSNIGYGEAASGISGITKVLLGYQKGILAGNLHCTSPRSDVPAIQEGKMKILTDHADFGRTYTAVNGISVTGANSHVLLHGHYKPKDLNRYKASFPQLVTISGRQETAVKKILLELKNLPVDPEHLTLFRTVHETKISGHMGRGFTILDTDAEGQTISIREKVDYFNDAKKQLWFVYSGMGSQWSGMGAQLMKIPIFAAAIENCRRVLEPKGLDIVHIITSSDKTIFDNILHSFVGIAAVQIGLTDILKELGIVPDKIIGHSVGELGCAYADGCFTAEEMILAAYSRGLVSVQTPFIRGSMAAVGIGYQEIVNLCPPEIVVACHNGPNSSTISGPAEIMKEFVAELTAKGIFAKEVPCSNIAYHSRYIAEAGPGLLKYLREVIKSPKRRSDRWVSTSVPQDRWGEESAMYSSAEYHTNNLLNSVLFEETSTLIPPNAVCIEIAPHGLLQAILKRSLPASCQHIPLTRRGHPDNVLMLLEAIGKLYMEGYSPKIKELYPKIEFPVSTGTPMLSHLVEWAHNEKWHLPLFVTAHRLQAAACKYIVSLHDEEHKYLQGNVVRGKPRYPLAGLLVSAWNTSCMSVGAARGAGGATFTAVRALAAPALLPQPQLEFSVQLHRATGRTEILSEHSKLLSGFTSLEVNDLSDKFNKEFKSDDKLILNSEQIYRILDEKDFAFTGAFRPILSANASFTEAEILYEDNWVTFIEGIFQLHILREKHDGVSRPFMIHRLTINVEEHAKRLKDVNGKKVATAHVFEENGFTRCGGVVIEFLKLKNLPPLIEDTISLKTLKFFPRFKSEVLDTSIALQVHLQVVAENLSKKAVNVVGIPTLGCDDKIYNDIVKVTKTLPGIVVNYKHISKDKILEERDHFLLDADLVVVQNLAFDDNLCQTLFRVLQRDTFVLNSEQTDLASKQPRPSGLYRIVSNYNTGSLKLELTKWRPTVPNSATSAVTVKSQSDIELLKNTRRDIPNRQKLVIFASYPIQAGLKQLVKKWRAEPEKNQIYVFVVNEKDAENLFDRLPELDLVFNTLCNGVWGGEYYVPVEGSSRNDTVYRLQSADIGAVRSLHWTEVPSDTKAPIQVKVHYAGLNQIDAKRAAGLIPYKSDSELGDSYFGMDYSGVTDKGVRVMGVVKGGAASSRIAASELTWPVPKHWTLEDAATVPLPYAHAAYCLGVKIRMWRNMRVLVHGGTGALGLAVISIALAHDCEVFATVSDVKKKKFLTRMFPTLQADHIGNSRDHSFGDMVLTMTKGLGCDVVISNLSGDLKNVAMHCCGSSGVLLDTVQLIDQEEYNFGMNLLTCDRNYVPIDFSSIFTDNSTEDLRSIHLMVAEGISRGYVRPLPRVVYSGQEASRALSLLQGSKHRGRVLLDVNTARVDVPRLVCSPDTTQVLLIDNEAFGLQVADRLVCRGARKLLIHVCEKTNYLQYKIRTWNKLGVQVHISTQNLLDVNSAVSLIEASKKLGALEGVFVVSDKKHDDVTTPKFVAVLANLDAAVRKLCPGVKNFSVITQDSDVGAQICLQRVADNLPATAVELPAISQAQVTEMSGVVSWRGAVEVVERGAGGARGVLRGDLHYTPQPVLEQILATAGISVPSDATEDTTLAEMGLEPNKAAVVAAYLQDIHSVAIDEGAIPLLTMQKIKEIDLSVNGFSFPPVSGVGTFFSFVETDELLATTATVFVPTLINNSTKRDDEFDVTNTHLCIVPGMEGLHARFLTLCSRLKLPALVLQPGLDRENETLPQLANRYAQIVLKNTVLNNHFYLLGYESGIIVALEMAAIFEQQGNVGTIYCVGTGPEELKAIVREQIPNFDDMSLKELVMRHMFTLMGGTYTAEMEDSLANVNTWPEKLNICVRTLLKHVPHSAQYARTLIECAIARIMQTANYDSEPKKLKSKIIFLHAKGQNKNNELQAYSEQPVTVYNLDTPLAHSAMDLRCSAIINYHLDSKIIDTFNQKNLCDTYLLNADTFMSLCNDNE